MFANLCYNVDLKMIYTIIPFEKFIATSSENA